LNLLFLRIGLSYYARLNTALINQGRNMQTNPLLWVNNEKLYDLVSIVGSIDLAVFYAQIKFQVSDSRIVKYGKRYRIKRRVEKEDERVIARSRKQLSLYNGKGITATMEDTAELAKLGLITKRVSTWKGKKRMFISCPEDYDLGINVHKLEILNKYTGGLAQSALLAYFAYWIEVNPFKGEYKDWAMVARRRAAKMLGVEGKTCDKYVKELVERGLIECKGAKRWGQRQYEVKINKDFYDKIVAEWKERVEQLAEERAENLAKREKSDLSIRTNNSPKVDIKNNNTITSLVSINTPLVDEGGNVILSKRQQNYLAEAIKRTLARCDVLTWSATTLMGHMRYVLGTPKNRESGQGFAHIINRAMFLVRKGLWQQPFGYLYYSEEGKKMQEALLPVNPASKCVVPGVGTIMMWDYSSGVDRADKVPSIVEIMGERKRLEDLGLSMEEVNKSLLAKFDHHGKPFLLKEAVMSGCAKGRQVKLDDEEWGELAKTDPVIRRALEGE
jgi:hypothetical protein